MNKAWQTLIARLDALSVRERIFLFASVVLCSAALFDVLWLSPAQTVHRQLTLRMATQGAELQRLRDQVNATSQADSVPTSLDQELQRLQVQLAQTNLGVRALLPPTQEIGRAHV